MEGTRIGHVRIERLLGEGGMGAVYLGFDEKLERPVAVKALSDERRLKPEAKARFLREARLLSRLDDPRICRIYDLVEDGDTDYLVLEYIDGVDLNEAADNTVSVEELLAYFLGIAQALAAAHREKIVHRDLKPDNVMVSTKGQVKVLDFGIARSVGARVVAEPAGSVESAPILGLLDGGGDVDEPGLGPTRSMAGDPSSEMEAAVEAAGAATLRTRVGSLVGTIRYMSPEQASGAEITEASDLYSLGVMMQEVLTGAAVYGESSGMDLLLKVYRADTAPIHDLDPEIARLIEEMTRIDPAARPDAERVVDRLQHVLDRPRRRRRRRFRFAVTASVVVAALVATAVVLNTRLQARRQAELAQSFARQAEEIAWNMRAERLSPVHDIRPAKEHVRRMMAGLETQMDELGGVAVGPGHAALGRGHLALREIDQARRHLEAAADEGFRSPESDFALGLVYGGLYRRALVRIGRISDPEKKALEVEKAERELRDPAVELLSAYRGQRGVMADFGKGLIAMYEKRYEEALEVVRDLGETAAWFYEAHQLEGDIHRELSALAGDSDRDVSVAKEEIRHAVAAFERATEIGRSDADLYSTLCGYRFREIGVAIFNTDPMMSPETVEAAFVHCETAVAIDPEAKRVESNRASLMVLLAVARERHGLDATQTYERATEIAGRAVELDPDDPGTHTTLGWAETMRADSLRRAGADPNDAVARSIVAYERVLELLGTEPSIITFIGNSCWIIASVENDKGEDSRSWIDRGMKWVRKGLESNPDHANLNGVAGVLLTQKGVWERDHGMGGQDSLRQAITFLETADQKAPSPDVLLALGHAYAEIAWSKVLEGTDPIVEIDTSVEFARRTAELFPGFSWSQILQGYAWLIRAEHAWMTGEALDYWLTSAREAFAVGLDEAADLHSEVRVGLAATYLLEARATFENGHSPERGIRTARAELDVVLAADAENVDALIAGIELDILDLRWRMQRGVSFAGIFERAAIAVENAAALAPGKAGVWLVAAEMHLWRARSIFDGGDGAPGALDDGMKAVTRALEINPRLGDAELVLAELELERSKRSGDAVQAEEAQRKALEALDRALELNAFLKRQIDDVRRSL